MRDVHSGSPHFKCVATLPCETLMSAFQKIITLAKWWFTLLQIYFRVC